MNEILKIDFISYLIKYNNVGTGIKMSKVCDFCGKGSGIMHMLSNGVQCDDCHEYTYILITDMELKKIYNLKKEDVDMKIEKECIEQLT